MPLPQVSGIVCSGRLANRTPHPVSGDHVAGVDREHVRLDPYDVAGVRVERPETVPVTNVGPGVAGQAKERVVELETWCHGRIATFVRKWNVDLAAGRRAQHGAVDIEPVVDTARVEPEGFELAEGERREAVSAALVSWEGRLVQNHHRTPGAAEFDRCGAAGRATADDHHVRRQEFVCHRRAG